jgi:hypothetical protein
MATIMDVMVELLCMIAVLNKPINKLINGLEVALMISWIILPLNRLNTEDISSNDSIKMKVATSKAVTWMSKKEVFVLLPGLLTSMPLCFNDFYFKV